MLHYPRHPYRPCELPPPHLLLPQMMTKPPACSQIFGSHTVRYATLLSDSAAPSHIGKSPFAAAVSALSPSPAFSSPVRKPHTQQVSGYHYGGTPVVVVKIRSLLLVVVQRNAAKIASKFIKQSGAGRGGAGQGGAGRGDSSAEYYLELGNSPAVGRCVFVVASL